MAAARLVVPVHRAQVRIVLVAAVTGRSDYPNAAAAFPCGEPLLVGDVLASVLVTFYAMNA